MLTPRNRSQDHYSRFVPTIGPVADEGSDDNAGNGKTGKNQSNDERRATELCHIEWKGWGKNGMLRIAQKLGQAEKSECGGPDGFGFRRRHRIWVCELLGSGRRLSGSMRRFKMIAALTSVLTQGCKAGAR